MTTDEKHVEKIKIVQELVRVSANVDKVGEEACNVLIKGVSAGKAIDRLELLFNASIKAMRDADRLNVGITDPQVN